MRINAVMKLQSGIPCRKGPELGLSDEKLISQNLRRIIGSECVFTVLVLYDNSNLLYLIVGRSIQTIV